MFISADTLNPDAYDAIVAGSGPAGATVALRLASHGKRVLIVETGGEGYDPDLQEAYTAISGRGHFDGDYWAGHWIRAFGGTSWAWNGWSTPLLERNFAAWPISRADLDPYYRDAADILNLPHEILSYSAPAFNGFDYRPFSAEPPLRFGDPDLGLFRDDANVDVLLNATVADLHANEERTALTSLSVFQPGAGLRRINIHEQQSVVLAAGGIGNAQILLASGPDDGPGIGNETDQVGRYLMEHPHMYDCARAVLPEGAGLPAVPESFGFEAPIITPDDRVFEEIGGLDVSIEFDRTTPNTADPIEVFLLNRLGGNARVYQLTVRSEMRADPANRVELGRNRDPSGLPMAHAWCVIGTNANRAADQCLQILGSALIASGPGRLRVFNDSLYRDVTGGGHIMGTTRMGSDPGTSVVNKHCRVHRYQNLYVAGSSVFTSGGFANPTLTIVALAARLGDHLASFE